MIQSANLPNSPVRQVILGIAIVVFINLLLAYANPLNAHNIREYSPQTTVKAKNNGSFTGVKKYYKFRCTKSMRCEGAKFYTPKKKRAIAIYLYE